MRGRKGMFVGREPEIEALERVYAMDGLRGVAVYGGRRIGKT